MDRKWSLRFHSHLRPQPWHLPCPIFLFQWPNSRHERNGNRNVHLHHPGSECTYRFNHEPLHLDPTRLDLGKYLHLATSSTCSSKLWHLHQSSGSPRCWS
ncbi:unnamed protein product [Brassica napus]|uniref:(rape) hypothetical protein n=1 Tax=Brassica napus TaxID=3708 RepID=A0A816TW85_BRANA|nr:unnamed protein product [Brassica napus]